MICTTKGIPQALIDAAGDNDEEVFATLRAANIEYTPEPSSMFDWNYNREEPDRQVDEEMALLEYRDESVTEEFMQSERDKWLRFGTEGLITYQDYNMLDELGVATPSYADAWVMPNEKVDYTDSPW